MSTGQSNGASPGPWTAQGCEVRAGDFIVARTTAKGWSEKDLPTRIANAKLIADMRSLLSEIASSLSVYESDVAGDLHCIPAGLAERVKRFK